MPNSRLLRIAFATGAVQECRKIVLTGCWMLKGEIQLAGLGRPSATVPPPPLMVAAPAPCRFSTC